MPPRRRIFREDAWTSLEPIQQGLVLGVGIGVVFWVFTGTLPWIAAGVGLGVGVGHLVGRRRTSPGDDHGPETSPDGD